MKKPGNSPFSQMKEAQQEMLQKLGGGHIAVLAMNRCISPRVDSKYSMNLYQFLTHKHKYLTNVFLDPENGKYYIGLREADGFWNGAELTDVNKMGSKVKVFSYPIVLTKTWEDVTKIWWKKYFDIGTAIFDFSEQTVLKEVILNKTR
jgi:hypothetical protein